MCRPLEEGQGVAEEVAINPVTHLPEEDATIAAAIREGHHYITKRGKPRVIVQWQKFMRSRRHYTEIPRYFGMTDEEVQVYMKICNEALVNIRMIGRVWGKHTLKEILEFIDAKQIPVYRWPSKIPKGYFVFSGDIVRAIKSCQIDMNADGGAWPKYMRWAERREERNKTWRERAKLERETGIKRPPRKPPARREGR